MKKIYFGNIRFLHQKKLKLQDFLEQNIGYWLFLIPDRDVLKSGIRNQSKSSGSVTPLICTLYSIHILLDIYVVNLFNCLNIYFRGIYIFHGKLHVPSHSTFSCHNEYSDKATINDVLPLKCGHVVATTVAIAQLCV